MIHFNSQIQNCYLRRDIPSHLNYQLICLSHNIYHFIIPILCCFGCFAKLIMSRLGSNQRTVIGFADLVIIFFYSIRISSPIIPRFPTLTSLIYCFRSFISLIRIFRLLFILIGLLLSYCCSYCLIEDLDRVRIRLEIR